MRRLILPIFLVIASIAAFQFSNQRGQQETTATAATQPPSPTTPLLSARRLPELLDQPRSVAAIETQLSAITALTPELSCLVAQSAGGVELVSHNGEVGLVAASVQKLVTGAAALQQFGPDARFRTVLATDANIDAGVIDGDLYLIGGGDPLLYTDDYAITFGARVPHTRLEDLADALVAEGITQINGGIIAQANRYDAEVQPKSWDDDGALAKSGRTGPLSALMVNDGFSSFPPTIEPGIFGSAANESPLHAAALFDDLLEARGVIISGGQRNEPEIPEAAVEVVALESLPMSEVVGEMLTFSDNTTAELLLKELGFVTAGEGTTDAGALSALELLGSLDVDVSTMRIFDGSGLSGRNRLSCRAINDILNLVGLDSDLGNGLAVSGRSGTLADRYQNPPLRNVVHAKTGTLTGAAAIAGFIETQPGDIVTFSFLMNVEPEIPETLLSLQDDLLRHLVLYPTGPPLVDLEPLGSNREAAAPYRSEPSSQPSQPAETEPTAEPTPPVDESDGGGGLGPDD